MAKKKKESSIKDTLGMYRRGKWAKAIDIALSLLDSEPSPADIWFMSGIAQAAVGKLLDSQGTLEKALESDPNHYTALIYLGLVYLESWKWKKASECLGRAIKIGPVTHSLRYNHALASRQANQIEEAIESFQQSLQIRPTEIDKTYFDKVDYIKEAKQALEELKVPWNDKKAKPFLSKEALNEMLLRAAYQKDLEKVKEAIEGGADINAMKDKKTALTRACDYIGSHEVAEYLIEKGADVNLAVKDNETPLTYASMYGRLDLVELLLDAGAEVNQAGGYGRTPLHFAITGGDWTDQYPAILKLLLEHGADPNCYNGGGDTPLLEAVWSENFTSEMAETVLKYDVDLSLANKYYKDTPLSRASDRGRLDLVKLFKGKQKTANAPPDLKELKKAIYDAYRNKKKDIVMYLLEESVDVLDSEFYGATVLLKAATFNHIDVIQWLIDHGLDLKKEIEYTNLALREAAYTNAFDVIKFLIEQGADVDGGKLSASESPLMKAARKGYVEMANYLLEKGANIEATDYWGNTPLNFAAWEGKLETVELLVEKGANVNAKNELNWTPLMQAAIERYDKIVQFLLKHGASVDVIDKEKGATVLILAAYGGAQRVVELILEQGVDRSIKDNEGKTAEDYARERGIPYLAEIIKNYEKKENPAHQKRQEK